MGVIIRWRLPDTSEATYTHTYIYRATSATGTFTNIASQVVTDNTYFDASGDSSNWYKIRYYTGSVWSSYSAAMQGGTFYGYCNTDDIRLLAGVPTTVTDSQLYDLQYFAQAQLNRDLGVEIKDEKIGYISEEKDNDINGVNIVYYVRKPRIGDYNDDGQITNSDISMYSIDGEGTRASVGISAVSDEEIGKFTVSAALDSSKDYYVSYRSTPVCVDPPNYLIRQACAYLVGSYAYSKLDIRETQGFRVGKVSVTKQLPASRKLLEQYNNTLYKVKSIVYKSVAEDII
jgi:hypothetical protein